MKKYIFGCLVTLATLFFAMPDVMAQPIKLHEQPESTVPNDDDACYSQERTGVDGKKYFLKFKFKTLKKFFGLKTGAGQLSYIPAATGNPAGDCNKIVVGSNGKQYIIDALGNATQIQAGASYTAGAGIVINGGAIAAKDTSATNEIQSLALNATGDSIVLNKGGGKVAFAAQQKADWNATSGVTEILNKPNIPTLYLYNQGLVKEGDSIRLGGAVARSRRFDFASADSGGELLLEGGKTTSNKFGDTKLPIRFLEQYDPNNAANYQKGIGLYLHTKDTTNIEPEINSAIYNFDAALNIQTDHSLNLQGAYSSMYGRDGVGMNSTIGNFYLANDNSKGLLHWDLANGTGSSGTISQAEFAGGIGNDSYFKISSYPRTRTDTSQIKNFLFTDALGVMRSRPIADLGATVSGSVSNGLTSVNGNTRLGGTVTTPATIDSERQIDFLPASGGYPSGRLILKEGQKGSSGNNNQNVSFPLLLSSDKMSNGTDGVGLLFKNSSLTSNVSYDAIVSNPYQFAISAQGGRGLFFSSDNGTLGMYGKNHFSNTYDTLGYFKQNHATSQSHTLFDKNGFSVRITSDTLYYGKINGYGNTNNYLCLSNYKKTRNDAGTPFNVLTTDSRGVVQSHPISELPGSTNVAGVYDMTLFYNGITTTNKAHYVQVGNTVTVSFNQEFNTSAFPVVTINNLPIVPSVNFADRYTAKGSANICNRTAANIISNVSPCILYAISGQKKVSIEWTTAMGAGQGAMLQGQFTYEITPSY